MFINWSGFVDEEEAGKASSSGIKYYEYAIGKLVSY
jgi:hypothetical protein